MSLRNPPTLILQTRSLSEKTFQNQRGRLRYNQKSINRSIPGPGRRTIISALFHENHWIAQTMFKIDDVPHGVVQTGQIWVLETSPAR